MISYSKIVQIQSDSFSHYFLFTLLKAYRCLSNTRCCFSCRDQLAGIFPKHYTFGRNDHKFIKDCKLDCTEFFFFGAYVENTCFFSEEPSLMPVKEENFNHEHPCSDYNNRSAHS